MCRSIFETKCEADETGVTRCGQEERRICAEDNCVLVEGEEKVIAMHNLNMRDPHEYIQK